MPKKRKNKEPLIAYTDRENIGMSTGGEFDDYGSIKGSAFANLPAIRNTLNRKADIRNALALGLDYENKIGDADVSAFGKYYPMNRNINAGIKGNMTVGDMLKLGGGLDYSKRRGNPQSSFFVDAEISPIENLLLSMKYGADMDNRNRKMTANLNYRF